MANLRTRISESCVLVCFLGNRCCNSPLLRQRVVMCQFSCLFQEIQGSQAALIRWRDECRLFKVQQYARNSEFLTNPSYLAGWFLGVTTMSIVGGQMNNIQPSSVAGQPLKQLTTSQRENVVVYFSDRLLANHVSLEITDVLIDTSVISNTLTY